MVKPYQRFQSHGHVKHVKINQALCGQSRPREATQCRPNRHSLFCKKVLSLRLVQSTIYSWLSSLLKVNIINTWCITMSEEGWPTPRSPKCVQTPSLSDETKNRGPFFRRCGYGLLSCDFSPSTIIKHVSHRCTSCLFCLFLGGTSVTCKAARNPLFLFLFCFCSFLFFAFLSVERPFFIGSFLMFLFYFYNVSLCASPPLSLSFSHGSFSHGHIERPGLLKWTLVSFTSIPHSHTCFFNNKKVSHRCPS